MKQYIVTLTDAEDKALSVYVADQNEWIQNAVHARCLLAIEELVQSEVERKLSAGEPIVGSKDDIVLQANVETAAERQARLEEEFRKLQEEQQG
jgi:DNA replication protein DnaD